MPIIVKNYTNLENGRTYYGKVFTRNPKGRVNNRVDLQYISEIPSAATPISGLAFVPKIKRVEALKVMGM